MRKWLYFIPAGMVVMIFLAVVIFVPINNEYNTMPTSTFQTPVASPTVDATATATQDFSDIGQYLDCWFCTPMPTTMPTE